MSQIGARMKELAELRELDRLYQDGKYAEIEPFLIKQIACAKEDKHYDSYIVFSNELISFYRSTSNHEKALLISEDVLLLMEELGMEDTVHFGTTLLNVATAYRAAGQNKEAITYYQRALVLYEKTLEHDDYRFAGLYNNLSISLQQMGETQKALLFLENAIEIISKIMPESVELATSLTNKALLLFQISKQEEACQSLEKALVIFDKEQNHEDPHYSAALAGLGEAYFHLGHHDKSVQAYEQAIKMIKKAYGINDSYRIVCYNCSVVCHEAGYLEKEKYYKIESERTERK